MALAVRLSGIQGAEAEDPADQQAEDDGALDEFLSSQGFEFIDARPSPDGSHQDLSDGAHRFITTHICC